jgi:hypothetical protein
MKMTLKMVGVAAMLATSALLTTMAAAKYVGKHELGMIPQALLMTYNIPAPLPQPTTRPTRNTSSAAAIAVTNTNVAAVSASFTFTAGDYLMVSSAAGVTSGAVPNVTSVGGGNVGAGWHKLGGNKTTVSGRALQQEMWGGFCTTSGTGSVTVNYDATVTSGYILVLAYTGVIQYVNNSSTGAVPTWTNNCGFNNTLSVIGYAGGSTGTSFTPTHTNISEVQAGSMAVVASTWNGSIDKGAITFTNSASQANCCFTNVNLKGTGGGS